MNIIQHNKMFDAGMRLQQTMHERLCLCMADGVAVEGLIHDELVISGPPDKLAVATALLSGRLLPVKHGEFNHA